MRTISNECGGVSASFKIGAEERDADDGSPKIIIFLAYPWLLNSIEIVVYPGLWMIHRLSKNCSYFCRSFGIAGSDDLRSRTRAILHAWLSARSVVTNSQCRAESSHTSVLDIVEGAGVAWWSNPKVGSSRTEARQPHRGWASRATRRSCDSSNCFRWTPEKIKEHANTCRRVLTRFKGGQVSPSGREVLF